MLIEAHDLAAILVQNYIVHPLRRISALRSSPTEACLF